MAGSDMRTAFILFGICCFAGTAFAQPLSRADAVTQALAANPTVKLSLEQVALLEGRILEERAAALPDGEPRSEQRHGGRRGERPACPPNLRFRDETLARQS